MKECSCRAFYSVINKYPEDKHFDCFKTQNEKRIIREMVYLDDYVLFYTTWIYPLPLWLTNSVSKYFQVCNHFSQQNMWDGAV